MAALWKIPRDCALRVTSHLKCARHEYQHHCWDWDLGSKQSAAIHQDDWIDYIWKKDGGEADEADDLGSKGRSQLEDRVKV